jgi:multimeric flavodoxin WrbA
MRYILKIALVIFGEVYYNMATATLLLFCERLAAWYLSGELKMQFVTGWSLDWRVRTKYVLSHYRGEKRLM